MEVSESSPPSCRFCGRKFRRCYDALIHERAVHTNIRPFACRLCNKRFAVAGLLKRHTVLCHDPHFLARMRCSWCLLFYGSKPALIDHLAEHTRSGQRALFKCRFCNLRWTRKQLQLCHERKVHTHVRPFECNRCPATFFGSRHLNQHRRTVHERTSDLYCCVCLRCFTGKTAITRHLETHTKGFVNTRPASARLSGLRCSWCFRSFPDKTTLREHLAEHTRSGQRALFGCRFCTARFVNRRRQLGHEKRVHTAPTFACRHCGKMFFRVFELTRHRKLMHERQSLVRCCWCVQIFLSKELLAKHLAEHLRSGHTHLFECRFCAKRFQSSSNRINHVRAVHCGRPFKCDVCPAAFIHSYLLRRHKRDSHSNDPLPFRCETCSKDFLFLSRLRRHVRGAHDRRYQCAQCAQQFTRKRQLRPHIRKVHSASRVFFCCVCLRRLAAVDAIERHLAWHARPTKERVKFASSESQERLRCEYPQLAAASESPPLGISVPVRLPTDTSCILLEKTLDIAQHIAAADFASNIADAANYLSDVSDLLTRLVHFALDKAHFERYARLRDETATVLTYIAWCCFCVKLKRQPSEFCKLFWRKNKNALFAVKPLHQFQKQYALTNHKHNFAKLNEIIHCLVTYSACLPWLQSACTPKNIVLHISTILDHHNSLLLAEMSTDTTAAHLGSATGKKAAKMEMKDPNKPKQPRTAFFYFGNEKRESVKAANPLWKMPEIFKELGRMWQELSVEEKRPYEQMKARDKTRYEKEMKEYRGGGTGKKNGGQHLSATSASASDVEEVEQTEEGAENGEMDWIDAEEDGMHTSENSRPIPTRRSFKCAICSHVSESEEAKQAHEYTAHRRPFEQSPQSYVVSGPFQSAEPSAATSSAVLPTQVYSASALKCEYCPITFSSPVGKSLHENHVHRLASNSPATAASIPQNVLTNDALSGCNQLISVSNVVERNNFVNGTSSGSMGSPIPATPVHPGVVFRSMPLKQMRELIKGVVDANGCFTR